MSRSDPYAEIREAEKQAQGLAESARELAAQAGDYHEKGEDNAASVTAAVSSAHSQAAISTMVAAGCISIQDLKR